MLSTNVQSIPLQRRIMVRLLITVALYPILLGGVANLQTRYRARWLQMRQEHRAAMDRDRARRERMTLRPGNTEEVGRLREPRNGNRN